MFYPVVHMQLPPLTNTATTTVPLPPAVSQSATTRPDDEKEMRNWIDANRPHKTIASINTYQKQFVEWCTANGRTHLPASGATTAEFMKSRGIDDGDDALAISTISNAIRSAIANYHKSNGYASPTETDIVRDTIKTIKRIGKQGPGGKLPITINLMKHISQHFGSGISPLQDRNRAMMLLMMAALLRRSEVVALQRGDVWTEDVADSPSDTPLRALFVYVQKSKTDQERRGETIVVSEASDLKLCPIEAFTEWNEQLTIIQPEGEYLFCNLMTGAKLSDSTPNHILKNALSAIGVDATEYGSHSLRKGGATAMAKANIEERLIRRHGRWLSDAVHVYITDSTVTKLNAARSIFGDATVLQ
jgi:site-specific recombinase XerD